MSEQKRDSLSNTIVRPKYEDEIRKKLTGDALENALNFIAYLRESGFTSNLTYSYVFDYLDHGVGVLYCFSATDWTIFWGDDDFFEYEDCLADEQLKKFAWDHVKICFIAQGKPCGCGSQPGKSATILGKNFENVCTSFEFANPNADDLEYIKKLVEISKYNVTKTINSYALNREEREARGKEALLELEKAPTRGEPIDIDLKTLVNENNMDVKFVDGLLEMTTTGDQAKMVVPNDFSDTIKIQLLAKIDGDEFRIWYKDVLALFREGNGSKMLLRDLANGGKFYGYVDCGVIPSNEYIDIEWIIGRDVMAVKINGEVCHACCDYNYIKYYKTRPGFSISSKVSISAAWGSTITVKHLQITKI